MMKYAMIGMFALLAVVGYVSAEVVSPLSLTEGASETRSISGLPTQSVEAEGGNVTALNIEALAVTDNWQGYYGNITGEITLDDAQNNTFYNWSVSAVQGEVYATRNASADFASTNCASTGEATSEETALGQSASDGDSLTNTYTNGTHPTFNVSTTVVNQDECLDTNAFSGGVQDTSRFHQVLLADGASSIIYTTLIDEDQVSFDSSVADFQILVGEDPAAGTTTYYFFVELD